MGPRSLETDFKIAHLKPHHGCNKEPLVGMEAPPICISQ
jgi:hypothetical protein